MDRAVTINQRDIDRFCVVLIGVALVLVAAFVVDRLVGTPIKRLVNIDGENSFAAWFSSLQLALIGLALLIKTGRCRSEQDPKPWFFLLGSAGFFFLSADEALFIHETITLKLRELEWVFRFKGDHGIWIPVYGALLLLLVAISLRQILQLWRHQRRSFLILTWGVTVFLAGAVGLEIIGYQFIEPRSALHLAEIVAEEFLEMAGATIVLYGSLSLLTATPTPESARHRPAQKETATAPLAPT